MSKAAELAALIGSQTALSNRNLIINGAMQVAQRGTSTSALASSGNYATDDRRLVSRAVIYTWSIHNVTDCSCRARLRHKTEKYFCRFSLWRQDYLHSAGTIIEGRIYKLELWRIRHLKFTLVFLCKVKQDRYMLLLRLISKR